MVQAVEKHPFNTMFGDGQAMQGAGASTAQCTSHYLHFDQIRKNSMKICNAFVHNIFG